MKLWTLLLAIALFCLAPWVCPATGHADDTVPPAVVATNPPNGATGVSRDLAQVSITFSEEMAESISISKNFPNFTVSWSQDKRTVYLTRIDQQTPLAFGAIYHFTLNPAGYLNFRDLHYCYLPQTGFSFITAFDPNAPYELMKVPAAPSKGFEWPYYLSIPKGLSKNTTLLVEPNNTGRSTDDWAVHDAAAFSSAKGGADFAVRLNAPLLVPTFPRPLNPSIPGGIYTHALDRESLVTEVVFPGGSIKRVDLQLMAMIRDAQERLTARGFRLDTKVFMMGFSASGAFTSRFTMLHPEIVRAAAPGSPGGWPLAPVSEWWGGTTLRYPVGIADVQSLTGKSVDLAAVRRVPQYIYVGDQDTNDALDRRGFPPEVEAVICANLIG